MDEENHKDSDANDTFFKISVRKEPFQIQSITRLDPASECQASTSSSASVSTEPSSSEIKQSNRNQKRNHDSENQEETAQTELNHENVQDISSLNKNDPKRQKSESSNANAEKNEKVDQNVELNSNSLSNDEETSDGSDVDLSDVKLVKPATKPVKIESDNNETLDNIDNTKLGLI